MSRKFPAHYTGEHIRRIRIDISFNGLRTNGVGVVPHFFLNVISERFEEPISKAF